MSRHYIAHATKREHYFVVGYDRAQDRFFLQVRRSRTGAPSHIDFDFDLDDLATLKAEVPPELRDILLKEARGEADVNAIMDWRLPPERRNLWAQIKKTMFEPEVPGE
jgi:hypothetical protein